MGILTAADKAWMATNFVQIAEDLGELATFKRLVKNATTKQSVFSQTTLTNVSIYIEPISSALVDAENAPVGQTFWGYTKHYAVPSQVQIGDLIVTASGKKYTIIGVDDFTLHLKLILTKYETPTYP